ncbi:MAG: DUF1320 domain-containing protein [Tagaea sp.]|nr:DUF1320 domain-containing protein [Tagaea sp.]
MPYATQADLIDRYGTETIRDLSDRATPPAGAIDAGVVAKALESASDEIDGYLRGRYALPLAQPFPRPLVAAACEIAFHRLHPQLVPQDVKDAYASALARLKEISNGVFKLDLAPAPSATSGADDVTLAGPGRVFDAHSMRAF